MRRLRAVTGGLRWVEGASFVQERSVPSCSGSTVPIAKIAGSEAEPSRLFEGTIKYASASLGLSILAWRELNCFTRKTRSRMILETQRCPGRSDRVRTRYETSAGKGPVAAWPRSHLLWGLPGHKPSRLTHEAGGYQQPSGRCHASIEMSPLSASIEVSPCSPGPSLSIPSSQ